MYPPMVAVQFVGGRRLLLIDGTSMLRLKPGIDVYDANGKLLFHSSVEVLSVKVDPLPVEVRAH